MRLMTNGNKLAALIIGLATFLLGLVVVSLFGGVFQSKFVTFALLMGAVALFVFKARCGGCCSR